MTQITIGSLGSQTRAGSLPLGRTTGNYTTSNTVRSLKPVFTFNTISWYRPPLLSQYSVDLDTSHRYILIITTCKQNSDSMHAHNMHSSPEPASLSMLTHTTTTTTSTTTTSLEHITFTISTNSQPAQFDISVSYGHKGWMRCLDRASHKAAGYNDDYFCATQRLDLWCVCYVSYQD